jgi:uncharacterized membrane protein
MSNKKQVSQKANNTNKSNKNIAMIAGIAIVLILAVFLIVNNLGGGNKTSSDVAPDNSKDLVIPKAEITDTAKFYPLNAGGTKLEILAIKASDGTIRTAFNTCQVCNGSAKAYYKQDGDVLVCQNCGNRFKADMVEQERGGCNPVPIMQQDKKDDGANIVISKDFIEQNKSLFTDNWKTE